MEKVHAYHWICCKVELGWQTLSEEEIELPIIIASLA
jgi:hypothetical protein